MNVRRAELTDIKEIADLLRSVGMRDDVWESDSSLESLTQMNNIYVALVDKKIVAVVYTVWFSRIVMHVYRLVVAPTHRQKGIASGLLRHVEHIAEEAGAQEVGFYVDSTNTDLQAFYTKRDYTSTKRSFQYYYKSITP